MNAKEELLRLTESNNLTILSIDCCNYDEIMRRELKDEEDDISRKFLELYKETAKVYSNIDDLDFEYDTCIPQDLQGTVYCLDKDTLEPVWLTRGCDEASSWWDINRVPKYFLDNGMVLQPLKKETLKQ